MVDVVADGVSVRYGGSTAVDGVSFVVRAGQTLALLGRNGAGKTTMVNAIAGRVAIARGTISLEGRRIDALPPSERCRRGLGLVPQDRQIFRSLTVDEHLRVAGRGSRSRRDFVYELFPRLAERRTHDGDRLSGGEQQMLAIARALAGNPTALLLDEPFEGLAPVIIDGLLDALVRLRAAQGPTVLIVEHHARLVMDIADAGVVLERGHIRLSGSRDDLLNRWREVEELLTVTGGRG